MPVIFHGIKNHMNNITKQNYRNKKLLWQDVKNLCARLKIGLWYFKLGQKQSEILCFFKKW